MASLDNLIANWDGHFEATSNSCLRVDKEYPHICTLQKIYRTYQSYLAVSLDQKIIIYHNKNILDIISNEIILCRVCVFSKMYLMHYFSEKYYETILDLDKSIKLLNEIVKLKHNILIEKKEFARYNIILGIKNDAS